MTKRYLPNVRAAPTEVIHLDEDNQANLLHPKADKGAPTGADILMREALPSQKTRVSPAKAARKPVGPSPPAQANSSFVLTVPPPEPTPMPQSAPATAFAFHRVPEDQVGASKEALIQVEVMNNRLREAYDASEALKTNVRVSTIVSVARSFCFEFETKLPSVGLRGAHPLGVRFSPVGAR